jgi:hypothetical protein
MGLNVGLSASFMNRQGWRGRWEKAGEVNFTKLYLTHDKFPVGFSMDVKLVY